MEDQQQHFVSLIEQNKALIYKFCYMYANEADTPQDLFQEVIINLWKGYPTFRGDCKVQTWIYRIALNTCVTFMRKSGSRPKTTALSEDLIVYDDATDVSHIKELYTLINKVCGFTGQLRDPVYIRGTDLYILIHSISDDIICGSSIWCDFIYWGSVDITDDHVLFFDTF